MRKINYKLNTTEEYHRGLISTLGWELTVCNALWPDKTPLRRILRSNDSFGHLLYDYLSGLLPMDQVKKIIEVGGGYGWLMKDFLDRNPTLKVLMLDISPVLLQQQREHLAPYDVSFLEADFLGVEPVLFEGFDLAIFNENLGDFPTLTGLHQDLFRPGALPQDPILKTARALIEKHGLDLPERQPFSLNVGAIQALEKLCTSDIPFIFLSEHSCEATVPESLASVIALEPSGTPEMIRLMGHDEYTLKFSHLEKVARNFGYNITRGPFADFIPLDRMDYVRSVMASGGRYSDEEEIIFHFVGDLYKYEYLLLVRR